MPQTTADKVYRLSCNISLSVETYLCAGLHHTCPAASPFAVEPETGGSHCPDHHTEQTLD